MDTPGPPSGGRRVRGGQMSGQPAVKVLRYTPQHTSTPRAGVASAVEPSLLSLNLPLKGVARAAAQPPARDGSCH